MKKDSLLTIIAFGGLSFLSDSVSAQTWTQTSAPVTNWISIACSADGSKVVAAAQGALFGHGGPIYISTNSGATWTQTSAPLTNWNSIACSADASKLLAAATLGNPGGPIYLSTNSGITWFQTGAPISEWYDVICSGDGTRLGAGGQSVFYVSTNEGQVWTPTYPGDFGELMTSIASSADGAKLIVGGCVCGIARAGRVYTSTNSGATWTPTSLSVYSPSIATSADGTKVVILDRGSVFTSTTFGASWAATTNIDAQIVTSSADGSKWVALGYGRMYASTNLGSTWTQTTAPTNATWKAMASSADGGKLVAAAEDGGIYCSHSTPTPVLNVTRWGSNALLSWTVPSRSFVLQENPDPTATNWTDVPETPALNFTNLQHQVTLPLRTGNHFYRLKR